MRELERDLITERCFAERYDPKKIPWTTVKEDVMRIEHAQFGRLAFPTKELKSIFRNRKNTIILLRDITSGKVIGYTCAVPLTAFYKEYSITTVPREDNGKQTAYICNTAIESHYTGHHLVGKMMAALEEALVSRTDKDYRFLERDSVIKNHYAENISKAYADRIIYQSNPHNSAFGAQIFFRIKLHRALTP